MTTPEATPRPWRAKGGPQDGVDYVVGPGRDDFLTGPLRRANARLIVEAVNNYDRLRRIEAAARDAMDWMEAEGSHPRPDPRPAMLRQADLLRAALDEESQP